MTQLRPHGAHPQDRRGQVPNPFHRLYWRGVRVAWEPEGGVTLCLQSQSRLHLPVQSPICSLIPPPLHPSTHPPTHPSTHPPIPPPTHPPIHPSTLPPTHLPIYLPPTRPSTLPPTPPSKTVRSSFHPRWLFLMLRLHHTMKPVLPSCVLNIKSVK